MRLTLHSFKPDVPIDKVCQPGIDYLVHEFDVDVNEASTFFGKLIYPRDSFYLENSTDYFLDFWKENGALWVEITGAEFWAYSEVSQEAAKAIIGILDRRETFGEYIPTTDQEWDAYAFLGDRNERVKANGAI